MYLTILLSRPNLGANRASFSGGAPGIKASVRSERDDATAHNSSSSRLNPNGSPSTSPALLEGIATPNIHRLVPDAFFRFQDLGKSSNDLLGKDFPIHGTALDVKTATSSGVSFKVALVRDSKAAIAGDIETKYNVKHHGLTLTQTWTTTNILRTQVELENQIAKGLKFDLATALLPEKGSKSALLTSTYKQPGLHTRAFLDIFKVRHLYPANVSSARP